ncbi:MAG TPA: outer membrane protein transport protein [Bacteroidia bacterium]|jgi:long-chain fatty acid transport protein|nr:outer membrane protein transport protein [Bacteroidia bacterium]
MKRKVHYLLFLLVQAPFLIQAQGFQVNLQGQKQQGMGGAGAALMQDASAVFFNPGGLCFLHENSANAGVSPVISAGTFQESGTYATAKTVSPVATPFAVYATWAKDSTSKFRYGLGAYTPFGSTIIWENGWCGRFELTQIQLFAVFIQPTVSYRINDKWGVGAGFVYAAGKVDLEQDMPVQDQNGTYGHAAIKGSANGYGFNGGLYYKACEKLNLGLTYRSQVTMNVSNGTATFTVPAALSSSFPSGSFTSSLPLPQVVTLGAAYTLNPKLTLVADANFVGWSTYDTIQFKYAKTTPQLQDTKLNRHYNNAYAFRLGGQYKVTDKFTGRLGMNYLISPVPDGHLTPDIPDANRLNLTAGVSYNLCKRFTADASFTFERLYRTGTDVQTNLTGTYKVLIYAPGISVIYKF